jgi:hypothetical protein
MSRIRYLSLAAVCAAAVSGAAWAGELNGNGDDNPLKGASICQFSGLNDDPDSTNPENPGGRTQSFGQNISRFDADPRDPLHQPGVLCNPNNLPWKDIGRPE